MLVKPILRELGAVGPLTAMTMAICASVTVSIGLEIIGAFSVIFFVRADVRSCGGIEVKITCEKSRLGSIKPHRKFRGAE